ncbi:MAG: OmpP1/FadL family transporter [Nitrospinota bacterium]
MCEKGLSGLQGSEEKLGKLVIHVKRDHSTWRILLICLLASVSSLASGRADPFHYNDTLIGGRASGMGGAYRAISDDPSGCFYNPAGIALSFEKSLSGSANVFRVTDLTFKNLFGGEVDWKKTSQTYNGNFIGYLNPLGKGKLGFSIVIPSSDLEKQDVELRALSVSAGLVDRYKLNRSVSDTTYLIGPSYGIELNSFVSVGATLYLHYRALEESQNELIFFNDSTYESNNNQNSLQEWGIHPVLGVIVSPGAKFSIGLTYARTRIVDSRKKGQIFQRRFQASSILWTDDCSGGTDDQCFIRLPEVTEKRKTPDQISLSLAYFPNRVFLVSADYIYHSGVSDKNFGDRKSSGDVALGIEYYFTRSLVMRSGLYTNGANTKKVETGKLNQDPHVNMYGWTLSFSHIGRTRSISFGGNYATGNGKGQGLGGSSQIQDVRMRTYSFFMSGEFHL